jgi:hypothetical protein
MKRFSFWLRVCAIAFLLLILATSICGNNVLGFGPPPPIQLNSEPGGDIYKEGSSSPDNQNGAMVWNGTEWVVNNTWAHTYFTDTTTGQRLISHDITTINSSGNYGGFQVTRNIYNYSIGAAVGGTIYTYQSVEYVVVQPANDPNFRKTLILRSRGSGHGLSQAYFHIYIQDPVAGDGTSAFRGDPVWFNYDGMTPQQAVNQTSETLGRAGNLPTTSPPERSQYWLDVDNGSDQGGSSYHFFTKAITSLTRNLGSSFATAFDIQYYEPASNTVKELRFFPELLNEEISSAPQGVGGEVEGINKLNMIIPWLTGALIIIALGVVLRLIFSKGS